MLNNPDALIEALQAYKAERMQRLALEAENAIQKQQLVEMQPKASYYDVVLNSPDLVSITEISKDYKTYSRNGVTYRYFTCLHAKEQTGEDGCCKRYIIEDNLNEIVWSVIRQLFDMTDAFKQKLTSRIMSADRTI